MSAPVVLGITIRADGSAQVSGEINRVREAVTGAGTAAQNTNREFANMARSTQALSGIMGAFGVTVGLVGFVTLAKNILSANMAMESLRAQLTALTGSALGSEKAFDFIKDFATSTPFEIEGVTKSFIMLQNFGLKPTADVMNALTNQAAKLGGSQETLSGITLALGQAYSKGKLQAEEMNQMIERGVPVYQILQELTGKNSAALQDMAHNGEITKDVMDGFIKKMGELASGGNAAAMETMRGKISNLSDAWHQFEDALLQDKSEGAMKSILSGMTFIINSFTEDLNRGTGSFGEIEKINDKIIAQKTIIRKLSNGEGMIPNLERPAAIASAQKELEGLLGTRQQEIVKYHDLIAVEKKREEGTKKFNEAAKEQSELDKKATKTLESLTTTNYKLTHSQSEYNKYTLEAQGFKGKDLDKALQLANANDALAASNKSNTTETKSSANAQEALTKSFDSTIESLNLHNIGLSKTPRELEEATLKSKHYTDAMVKQAMALYDIGTALEAKKKLNETEKTELQALTDQYNKLTLSAHDYYATTLSAKGIPTADQAPLIAQFDTNTGLEASKKAATDATTTLDAYNKSLDSTNSKTSDLGKISSAVFDGALGGISAMAGAFDTMVNSIGANTKALEENAKMQKLNDQETDPAKKAANFSKYAKEEAKLNNDNIKAQLTGASQLAGAAASMFDKKSAAAKAFHAIEVTLSVARLAMDAVEMASTIGKTIANVSAGAAAMFRDMGPLGFVGVAAMLAVMAGLGFAASGGGSSTQAPPKSSPDTGSVLGDTSASSDSVNKTYTLLQDIHASEYIELKGINKGVADLQSAITATITKVFQTGGLDTSNKGINLSASQINLGIASMIGGLGGILLDLLFSGGYRKVTERGISTPAQQLSNVDQNGFQAQQYNVVKTKTWDLFSDSTRYDTVMTALDSKVTESMTKIFSATGNIMTGLAKSLGGDLQAKVNEYVIPALRINLTDLNSEDAAKKMNGIINTMLDNMAGAVFGDVLGQYQKLGEGMLETAVRIVAEMAIVKDALGMSGLTLTQNIIAVSDAIVQAAGGLKEFQAAFESYFDKFYSDSEKTARTYSQMSSALSDVGLTVAATRAGYRAQIEALNINNALDQQRYSLLISLSSAADTYYSSLEKISDAMKLMTESNFKTAVDYTRYLSLASLSGVKAATTLLGWDSNTFMPTGQAAVAQLPTLSTPAGTTGNVTEAITNMSNSNTNVAAEIKLLRDQQAAQALVIAQNTQETAKLLKRWDGDGMPAVRTTV